MYIVHPQTICETRVVRVCTMRILILYRTLRLFPPVAPAGGLRRVATLRRASGACAGQSAGRGAPITLFSGGVLRSGGRGEDGQTAGGAYAGGQEATTAKAGAALGQAQLGGAEGAITN